MLNIYKNGNIKSTLTYDLNGNQRTETTNREKDEVPGKAAGQVTKEFIYDKADRLYKLKTKDGENLQEVTNYYNGNGQRTKQVEVNKKVEKENEEVAGTETNYFYNNGKLLFTTDLNQKLIEDNMLDPSGKIISSRRNDGEYPNKYFFYGYDTRGSVNSIINPDGKLIKGYSYDEFGDTEERGDKTFKNSVKFTGAVQDSSTGLYYMNSRFYNPSTARFLTQDTYTGNAYEPWTQHLYSYCGNDPINYTDPTGHMREGLDDSNYYDSKAVASSSGSQGTGRRNLWDEFVDGYKEHQTSGNLLYDEVNFWLMGIPDSFKKISQTTPFTLENLKANGEAFLKTAPFLIPAGKASELMSISKRVSKAEILAQNRAFGAEAEKIAAKQLIDDGYEIIGSQVSIRTSAGRRIIDHLVRNSSGNLMGIEVKSGNAIRNASQLLKDGLIETEGGILVGKNAGALSGKFFKFATEEIRIPR